MQTKTGVLNKMSTVITSCSSDTMTDLVVVWDPGSAYRYAMGCVAPQTTDTVNSGTFFTLSPGASLKVNCQTASLAGPATVVSGTGTVTLYGSCESLDRQSNTDIELPDVSLIDTTKFCSDVSSSQLAQQAFSWAIDIPATQTGGGGKGGA